MVVGACGLGVIGGVEEGVVEGGGVVGVEDAAVVWLRGTGSVGPDRPADGRRDYDARKQTLQGIYAGRWSGTRARGSVTYDVEEFVAVESDAVGTLEAFCELAQLCELFCFWQGPCKNTKSCMYTKSSLS